MLLSLAAAIGTRVQGGKSIPELAGFGPYFFFPYPQYLGGLFVIEALSVILQVGSFKLRRKRIFRMAPLHHHFELVGWKEPQIIIRFWIVAFIFATFTLMTLKLR